MPDAEPQAILTPITEAAIFLTLVVEPGGEAEVRDALTDVSGLRRSVGFRIPEGALTCIAGLGAAAWDRLFGAPRPAGLRPFKALDGPRHRAPATPGDLFFHLRAHRLDLCFELAQLLVERFEPSARVVDEVHGFRSFDQRDLLGFVDGTENPEGAAAQGAVTVGGEDPAFAGGSYLVVQKYVHDLRAWNALTVEQQELVIGRRKANDVELPDELKPADSHVALNTIVDADGEEQQIVRYNMPFGRVGAGEFGTYFAGYARSPDVIDLMLEHMFIGDPPGTTDRILDFSTALTGNLFFIPSAGFLDDGPAPARGAGGRRDRTHGRRLALHRQPQVSHPVWTLPRRLAHVWERRTTPHQRAGLAAWTAFGVTFGITRAITYSLRARGGSGGIVIKGRHIHHYNFGIALLGIVGAAAVRGDSDTRLHERLAFAYGSGMALIVDELALLLDLQDVYWATDGRKSVDAAIGVIAVGGVYLSAAPFWHEAAREVARTSVAQPG